MNIPQPLADLLNKTEPEWIVFAHMVPTRVFRVVAKRDFCAFRVEQFTRTNSDDMNPIGTWFTKSAHADPVPGRMLQAAMLSAMKIQKDFVAKMQKRAGPKIEKLRA